MSPAELLQLVQAKSYLSPSVEITALAPPDYAQKAPERDAQHGF